jgi:hypothetical protein
MMRDESEEESAFIEQLRGRVSTIATLEDGGERVQDNLTGVIANICPYCRVGDCLREAMDAMSCPRGDYRTCSTYQAIRKERGVVK